MNSERGRDVLDMPKPIKYSGIYIDIPKEGNPTGYTGTPYCGFCSVVCPLTDASNMTRPPSQPSFVLPLTFSGLYGMENKCINRQQNTPLTSVRNARPTCMENWTRVREDGGQVDEMLIVGCEDGSLYVFHHQDILPSTPQESTSSIPTVVVKPPPTKKRSRGTYPFETPTSGISSAAAASHNSAFWKLSSRPRAVSGVSIEQVEAPTNYVDFDDEPDKLKGMLEGRNPVTKVHSDASSEKAVPATHVEEPAPTRRKDVSKVLINITPPSRPFSPPTSPRDRLSPDLAYSDDLELLFHIIPHTKGIGNAVKSISILPDLFICVVLQESGYVFLPL